MAPWLTAPVLPTVAGMLNRLHGQPESYEKKYVPPMLLPTTLAPAPA